MRVVVLAALGLVVGCGGDDNGGGLGPAGFEGTYSGEFYAIATSTNPSERDSVNGGAITVSLDARLGDSYDLSTTTQSGGFTSVVNVDASGAMSFPNFDPNQALRVGSALLGGICDVQIGIPSPSGSVSGRRLTFTLFVDRGICQWGSGDNRRTDIQLTWTGTRS